MSLAYAATELTHVGTSRQLTLSTGLLLALVFAAMAGIAAWSWLNRRRLLERRRSAETELRATQNRLAQVSNQLPIALFSFRPGYGFEAAFCPVFRRRTFDHRGTFSFVGHEHGGGLLLVCHCEHQAGDIIRIISARKATKTESTFYGSGKPHKRLTGTAWFCPIRPTAACNGVCGGQSIRFKV